MSLFLFLIALALQLVRVADVQAATNLISNPSVELGTGLNPNDWFTDKWGINTPTYIYPVAGKDGMKAVKIQLITRSTGDAKWYFKEIPVVPGTTYYFSDYYQSNISNSLVAQFKLTTNRYKYIDMGTQLSASNWTLVNTSVIAPANAKTLTVYHLISSVGWLTTDNFYLSTTPYAPSATPTPTLIPTPTPTIIILPTPTPTILPTPTPTVINNQNLILNASLETNTNPNIPDNWAQGNWGTNTANFSYPVAGQDGTKAARIDMTQYTNGDAKWYFQDVPVTAGTTYTISDFYQSDQQTFLVARYLNTTGTYGYVELGLLGISPSWTNASATFTIPANIQSMTVFHLISSVGFLVVDNVSLIPMPTLPTFTKGMVSLDFDDGWLSTFQNGIPILDAAGYKSTQYIITGYMQFAPTYVTSAQVQQMNNNGHDIEAHSQTHPDLTTLTQAQITQEISGSKQDLINIGITPVSFAFPYGTYNSTVLQTVKDAGFSASRTALIQDGGFNYKNQNPYLLKTQDVQSATTLADIQVWIDNAATTKTWLILTLHSVAGDGTQYDTPPAKLQSIVNYLKTSNVDVVTVKQGVAQLVP